jgi:RTX calcium-binding nonapeptide repeat (4 copies)
VDLSNPNAQDFGALGKDQLQSIETVQGSQYDDVLAARLGLSANTQVTGAGDDTVTDVENLTGSPHADALTGDDGANTIDGGDGADSIVSKGGPDKLLIRDGGSDQATCGAGGDQVVADAQGTDTIFSDCESIDFAPAPVVQPPPPPASDPGNGSGDPTPTPAPTPAPAGDHTPPVLSALKLKGKTLSYRLSERATVKFRVQLKKGRKWKAPRTQSKAGLAGLNKLRLARRGRYRVTAIAKDAAGNQSGQRVVSFRVTR